MTPASLDAICIFLAVAEMKSFTAAAIRIGVTPAAASNAVKLLEAQHGVIHLTRNTRRVTLTDAGSALYGDLRAATGQIDDAFNALTRYRDRPAGTLRLTVSRALGALVLKDLVQRATIRYRFHRSKLLARWQFTRDGATFQVETGYTLVVNASGLIAQFACAGLGLAYLPDVEIAHDLAAGCLELVLGQFVPRSSGLYLYFAARSQTQPKPRAFIDMATSS